MKFQAPFALAFLTFFLSGCMLLGINIKRKTPKREGKYPKFTQQDSIQGTYNALRSNNDVTHYDLNLDIDTKERYLKGSVKITMTALEDLNAIQLDLFENMVVDQITSDAGDVNFSRDGKAMTIEFAKEVQKGSTFKVEVAYQGKPVKAPRPPWNGGFVWKKDDDKDPFVGVACELKGASLWWPLKDHLMDEADSVDLHFSVPETLTCVSNGQLISRDTIDGKTCFHWHVSYPINSYNVTLYIADYTHFTMPFEGIEDTFDLDFYVLPEHLIEAKEQFKQAPLALDAYEEYFGAYPWPRDGYKLVESPYAGMEHQSAIAYGEKFKNAGIGSYDYIIIHETAHEWWGNSVTATDFAEAWIHEGFATYSEALVEEKYNGYDAYIDYMSFTSLFIKNKRPVVGPTDVKYWDYHDNDLYMKGAAFLHTLRIVMNSDDKFFDILKTFYQQHKLSYATTEDFQQLVNEKSGEDYTYLFDQYLYSRECPELEYSYTYNELTGKSDLVYRWTNIDEDFKMPLRIKIGSRTKTIIPTREPQVIHTFSEQLYLNPRVIYVRLKNDKKLTMQSDD